MLLVPCSGTNPGSARDLANHLLSLLSQPALCTLTSHLPALAPFLPSLPTEMEAERLLHPACHQWPLHGSEARAARDQQVPGGRPCPAVAAVATHLTVAPETSCTFCMRLGDRKGLGRGSVKRALSISSHFCRNHQPTPRHGVIVQSLPGPGLEGQMLNHSEADTAPSSPAGSPQGN